MPTGSTPPPPDLLALADGRFPAGGHAHSHGVEAVVGRLGVDSVAEVGAFLEARLSTSGTVEAAFAAHTADRLVRPDPVDWRGIDLELDARIASPALRFVSRRLGRQLLRAAGRIWDAPATAAVGEAFPGGPHHAVALGAVVGTVGGTPADAAALSLHHLAAGVVSAAVRLLGLDPYEVQALLARTSDHRHRLALAATALAHLPPAELPVASVVLADVFAEDHARSEGRLFAS